MHINNGEDYAGSANWSVYWDRSRNQRQFRSSGERHQQRLVPLVSPHRKRTKPSPSLFRSTEERRSPGILFLVSIARATARRIFHRRLWLSDLRHLRGCSLSVPRAAKLWRASASSDRRAQDHGFRLKRSHAININILVSCQHIVYAEISRSISGAVLSASINPIALAIDRYRVPRRSAAPTRFERPIKRPLHRGGRARPRAA